MIQVPEQAVTYNGVVEGLVGDPLWITDTLGTKFDYGDLMSS
jgi:hypothetical protein